jgi:Fic family protein
MSGTKKITELILKLLSEQGEVSIRSIARAGEFSETNDTDRKAIRRALVGMEKQGELVPKGAGRSRVYVKAVQDPSVAPVEDMVVNHPSFEGGSSPFKDITLSTESEALLRHVSRSLTARVPVGYNQDFLRSYKPNETFYLSKTQREALYSTGRVEVQTRPAGTYARNIMNRLLIDLSWNSSRLEGNTYSLLETKRLIELGESATGKDASEAQMILNHKAAIEYIVESAESEDISSHEVCNIHALLSENLLGDPSASGRVRAIAVGIGGTTYMPLENPHILKECFDIFIEKLNLIEDPFEQSLFSLIQLSYMQAFEDVNKRTARLVANIPLIKKNLKPLSFTDVNQEAYVKALLGVYEKNDISLLRDLYVWAYTRSSQRYSAIQQAMGEPNLLKLKYRTVIQEIVRSIILEKVEGAQIVAKIQSLVQAQNLAEPDKSELFKVIETEILSLHDGNIARFKVRPSQYQEWKELQ